MSVLGDVDLSGEREGRVSNRQQPTVSGDSKDISPSATRAART